MTPFLVNFAKPLLSLRKLFKPAKIPWGRYMDRGWWSNAQPAKNPDPVDRDSQGSRYYKASLNTYVKTAFNMRDISRFFVSAAGLEPNETGAYYPAQLLYTSPELANQEQFERLAKQYDEDFDGGFAPILRSLHQPAMQYGRGIGEIDWQRDGNKIGARFIDSHDPEEFLINPPDHKPGIYRKTATKRDGMELMQPHRFMLFTYDPLFNNPYGQAATKALVELIETWNDVRDARRMALIKAGYGSWLGEYGPEIAGNDLESKNLRDQFLEQIKLVANGTASMFDARNNIRAEKLDFEAAAFQDYEMMAIQAVSVLLTGSPTTLLEGRYGSYSKEESTTVRQKSQLEQSDALFMGLAFTYQFNEWFLKLNFADVQAVPQLQLIEPTLIQPTIPEGQDRDEEDEEEEKEEPVDIKTKAKEPPPELQALTEFQDGEERDQTPEGFPDDTPLPDFYIDIEAEAKKHLGEMNSITYDAYKQLPSGEEPNNFTIKRLKNNRNAVQLIEALKQGIAATIGNGTEAEAWNQYLSYAKGIWSKFEGEEMTKTRERELMTSFRMARANAYAQATKGLAESNPDLFHGFMIDGPIDSRSRLTHKVWVGFVAPPDDIIWDRMTPPLDFNCRHFLSPVTNLQYEQEPQKYRFTPEAERPQIYPGETYRQY